LGRPEEAAGPEATKQHYAGRKHIGPASVVRGHRARHQSDVALEIRLEEQRSGYVGEAVYEGDSLHAALRSDVFRDLFGFGGIGLPSDSLACIFRPKVATFSDFQVGHHFDLKPATFPI
jgi:hypothetical protein